MIRDILSAEAMNFVAELVDQGKTIILSKKGHDWPMILVMVELPKAVLICDKCIVAESLGRGISALAHDMHHESGL